MKTHASRYRLTWIEKSQRWRKRYQGKDYYFSGEGGKVASYPRAMEEWEAKRKEIDAKDSPPAPPPVPASPTINANALQFLSEKRQQAERGSISIGRYDKLRVCLMEFVSLTPDAEIKSINRDLLYNYRQFLLRKIDEGRSAEYARNALQVCKQFVRWCWERELIELPRILESKDFTISAPDQRIEVFSKGEIKTLLDASSPSTRLYILLMLNCGFTQSDIAALRQDQVDWTNGRIKRRRGKTSNHKAVPEVDYKLWPETFKLLEAHRSKHETLALTNRKGQPLKTESIKANGKIAKSDNVRSAFNRVAQKVKFDKTPKLLRKTAASKLAEHAEFGKYAQHFLGHAPRTIADKHYILPSQEQFDRALDWLQSNF